MINASIRQKITDLKKEYETLRQDKEALLAIIDEAELPELVYNSNAIENSTLTLQETEQILLEQEVMRQVSVRELFEAKNLARVTEYLRTRAGLPLTRENILLLHQMLIGGINDKIAGRFRQDSRAAAASATRQAPRHPYDSETIPGDCRFRRGNSSWFR